MNLRVLYTHLAATYFGSEIACFQGLLLRRLELLSVLDSGHPETDLVHVIMTLSFITIALDERRCTEVFETGSGTGQGLSSALGTSARVLQKIIQRFFFFHTRLAFFIRTTKIFTRNNIRTMRKLYPIQRPVHPCGQSGIFND